MISCSAVRTRIGVPSASSTAAYLENTAHAGADDGLRQIDRRDRGLRLAGALGHFIQGLGQDAVQLALEGAAGDGRGVGGVHGQTPGELGRNLDHRLVDQLRYRVQIAGIGLQPQALGFQRQRAATGKGIMKARQLVRVEQLGRLRMVAVQLTGLAPGLANLRARPLWHLLVGGVLPAHQFLKQPEQALATGRPTAFQMPRRHLARMLQLPRPGGIIHQLGKDHRPRRRQRSPRPPQVQGARMPVADRLLPRRCDIDGIERQGDFDQLLGGFDGVGGHKVIPWKAAGQPLRTRVRAITDISSE